MLYSLILPQRTEGGESGCTGRSFPLQRYGCCKNHFCIHVNGMLILISLYMKTCSIALLLVFPNLVTYRVSHLPNENRKGPFFSWGWGAMPPDRAIGAKG